MYADKLPIQSPEQWIEQNYGPLFNCRKKMTIADYPLLLMNFFPEEKDHCSLVALASVFHLYAGRGYRYLTADEEMLFYRIRRLARLRLMSVPRGPFWKGGTMPFGLSGLVRSVWRFYGYGSGKAANRSYLFSGKRAAGDLMASLNRGQPVLLSLSSGYYRKHTVTIYGYELWEKKASGRVEARPDELPDQLIFIRINDHWTARPRYLELGGLDPAFGGPFFLLTFIEPPLAAGESPQA